MSDETTTDDHNRPDPITNLLLESRQVIICEGIDQKMAKRVTAQLLALAGDSDKPITMFINSQGGHVEAGDTIHDIILTTINNIKSDDHHIPC